MHSPNIDLTVLDTEIVVNCSYFIYKSYCNLPATVYGRIVLDGYLISV